MPPLPLLFFDAFRYACYAMFCCRRDDASASAAAYASHAADDA